MKSLGQLVRDAFEEFEVIGQWNSLTTPYDSEKGWPIQYPIVETWNENTIVVMHLQDFVTIKDGCCLELDAIENHFGEYASRVVVVNWTMDLEKIYKGPLRLMYFPYHSYLLLHNLAETRDEWQSFLDSDRTVNWQCLNGTTRKHRQLIAPYLQENYNNGILSLGTKIPLPDWDFSSYTGCDNETNWMRLLPVYSKCAVNIVTETFYYTPGIITEKTIMAFLGLQIPIVIGHRGIVEQLERLGFDMFTDLVNIDYDLHDNDTRWHCAILLNNDVINGKFDRTKYIERLKRNQQYVLDAWPELLVEQFNSSAQDILQNLRQSS